MARTGSATIGDADPRRAAVLGGELCVDGVQFGRCLRRGCAVAQPAEEHQHAARSAFSSSCARQPRGRMRMGTQRSVRIGANTPVNSRGATPTIV